MLKKLKNFIFLALQYLLPHHVLSRAFGRLAESRVSWFKNLLIRLFIAYFKVDLKQAKLKELQDYPSFNDFFIRELATPFPQQKNMLTSPAEGYLSEFGSIQKGTLIQAKGQDYSLNALLAGDKNLSQSFQKGRFATVYLAPFNYHRVHMPLDAQLDRLIYVPGKLFSVNLLTTAYVPELFAKNERLILSFSSPFGKIAVIMVGAMFVAGIENPFVSLSRQEKNQLQDRHFGEPVHVQQGEELGYFKFGSTVIVLVENPNFSFMPKASTPLALGEALGHWPTL